MAILHDITAHTDTKSLESTVLSSEFKEVAVKLKNFHQLSPGDIFKATVMDIMPNRVSIRLQSGGNITAKSLVLPDARIGSDAYFIVKENNKGQILLEMLRPQNDTLLTNIAKEALVASGIYPTDDNMRLVRMLMDNNLPIDAASLQKAVYFRYSAANIPVNQLVFLLKENFTMNNMNVDILRRISTGDFAQKLAYLLDSLQKEPPEVRNSFTEKFPPILAQLKNGDVSHLLITLKNNNSLESLTSYYKTLYAALKKIEAPLIKTSDDTSAAIKETVRDLIQQLEFMDHISNYKYYAQIPLILNDKAQTAELYVFKQPNKKPSSNERMSALITLNNDNIGRVETFIELEKHKIRLQFRTQLPVARSLISSELDCLTSSLSTCGYTVIGVSYKPITESFTIADDIPAKEQTEPKTRRYAFDMRV